MDYVLWSATTSIEWNEMIGKNLSTKVRKKFIWRKFTGVKLFFLTPMSWACWPVDGVEHLRSNGQWTAVYCYIKSVAPGH